MQRNPAMDAEGKSERVSGFDVKYGGRGFALIFLAKYASILFMSLLFCIIFLGSDLYSFLFYFRLTFISFLFVWVCATLPRFRYDGFEEIFASFIKLSFVFCPYHSTSFQPCMAC